MTRMPRSRRFFPVRAFTTSIPRCRKLAPLPPRPKVNEAELEEAFLKGSGPGGQKINKTNSAVQLKHLPTGVVVKSQATRSREQNRKIARGLLAEKLEEIEKGSESRKSVKRERESKKKRSAQKKKRRKYRALEAGKGGVLLEGEENGEGEEEDGKEEEGEEWVVESEEERRVRVEGRDEGLEGGLVKNEAMEGEMLEGVHIKR